METTEVIVEQKLQMNLNTLIENTSEEAKKKWKKTLISSLVITLVNQKEKEIWNNQNKTLQHDKN